MSVKNQMKRKMKKQKQLNLAAKAEAKAARISNARMAIENREKQLFVSLMLLSDEIYIEQEYECECNQSEAFIPMQMETMNSCLFCSQTFKTETELHQHISSHSAMVRTIYFQNMESAEQS